MNIPIYQVDAFASNCFSGNPAAVCILNSWLSSETMQAIAQENNLSETAFLVGCNDRYELRWFTPLAEMDLCGHATLASAYVLIYELGIDASVLFFESRSGELQVTRRGEDLELNFPADDCKPVQAPDRLEEALGTSCPEVFRGKTDYLVIANSQAALMKLAPNFHLMRNIGVRGVIVTAPGDDVDFVSRFFAPEVGVDEDPVTGSAHTTLTPYWSKRLGKSEMSALQLSTRGGELQCTLQADRVLIRGKAVLYLKGEIYIPD
ncbi:MAG: PhzF family phenazine biosynthesis protein [Flavobacteriales bacterium]|jgi:PhzF family phenazine biosynthesis protein